MAFENLVNPFQPFIIGQKNVAPKIALKYGIKLIMYGENHAEAHNTLKMKILSPLMNIDHYTISSPEENLFFGGVSNKNLSEFNISKNDIKIYIPELIDNIINAGIEVHFMSFYKNWSLPKKIIITQKKNSNFQSNPDGRSEGTYSKNFQALMIRSMGNITLQCT